MELDPQDFFAEYDDLSARVRDARHQDFVHLLQRWFDALADAPHPVSRRVAWLRTLSGWDEVEATMLHGQSGMGPGTIKWPRERERRLAAQLSLFDYLSNGDADTAWNFANDYFATTERNIDDILHKMTDHLFDDFQSELRRYLERHIDQPLPDEVDDVPASDRIVRLDHNNPGYSEALAAVDKAAAALVGDNTIGQEDRDRIKFELNSGMLLLQANSVRQSAIEAVLISALRWLSTNFAGAALGIAAEHALLAVLRLLAQA